MPTLNFGKSEIIPFDIDVVIVVLVVVIVVVAGRCGDG
jgi:hypothetical protein